MRAKAIGSVGKRSRLRRSMSDDAHGRSERLMALERTSTDVA
jgi:hypothetical protein